MKRFLGILIASFFLASAAYAAEEMKDTTKDAKSATKSEKSKDGKAKDGKASKSSKAKDGKAKDGKAKDETKPETK